MKCYYCDLEMEKAFKRDEMTNPMCLDCSEVTKTTEGLYKLDL